MNTQYNQGASLYNSNNNTSIQIPSIVFSTTSNSYQNITVAPQNIIKISTNLATSMTKMSNFTTTINEINQNITTSVALWNANPANATQQLTIQSLLPNLNGTLNYFENGNQVMDFNIFGNLFFSNGSKRSQPNYYFSKVASFNINALTYANTVSSYNPISLSNLVTNQICTNNNVGLSSLDSSLVIDLHNNLKNYTNLSNLIGSYHCLDIESLYNNFVGFGYVKYDLDYNNTNDVKPNVYGGALIQLINRYNIYVSVPNISPSTSTTTSSTSTTSSTTSSSTTPTSSTTSSSTTPTSSTTSSSTTPIPGIDNYQIQLDVSYLTYFGNLVSQAQLNSNISQNTSSSNGTSVSGLTVPSTQQTTTNIVPIGYNPAIQ
jgi:hypothetical protein